MNIKCFIDAFFAITTHSFNLQPKIGQKIEFLFFSRQIRRRPCCTYFVREHRGAVEAYVTFKCSLPFKLTGQKQKDGLWNAFLINATHVNTPITVSIRYGRQLVQGQKLELLKLHKSPVSAFFTK